MEHKNHVPISTNQPDYSPIHVPSMSHSPFSQPKNPAAKVLPPVHINAMSSGTPPRSGRSGLGGQPGAELVIFDQGEVAQMELEPSKNRAKCWVVHGWTRQKIAKMRVFDAQKMVELAGFRRFNQLKRHVSTREFDQESVFCDWRHIVIEPPKKMAMNFRMGWAKLKAQPENGLTCHFLNSKPSQLFDPFWDAFRTFRMSIPALKILPFLGYPGVMPLRTHFYLPMRIPGIKNQVEQSERPRHIHIEAISNDWIT